MTCNAPSMRYLLLILPSVAGSSLEEAGGRSPLQLADTPTIDSLAQRGRVGALAPDLDALEQPTTGAAALAALLGATPDPHTGALFSDAQARAAAADIRLEQHDLALRLDFITLSHETDDQPARLIHPWTPSVTHAEARELLHDLNGALRDVGLAQLSAEPTPDPPNQDHGPSDPAAPLPLASFEARLGRTGAWRASACHILIERNHTLAQRDAPTQPQTAKDRLRTLLTRAVGSIAGEHDDVLRTVEPEFIVGQPIDRHLPRGPRAQLLRAAFDASREAFTASQVNAARREAGLPEVSAAWFSGQPPPGPPLPHLSPSDAAKARGLSACLIAAEDEPLGVAKRLGFELIAPTDPDDSASVLEAATLALERYDLVVVHDRRTDRAAFGRDPNRLIAAVEEADQRLLAPLLSKLERAAAASPAASTAPAPPSPDQSLFDASAQRRHATAPFRVAVAVDRPVDAASATPIPGLAPVAIGGAWLSSVVQRTLTELHAHETDLRIVPSSGFLEFFLRSGLRGRAAVPPAISANRTPAKPNISDTPSTDQDAS